MKRWSFALLVLGASWQLSRIFTCLSLVFPPLPTPSIPSLLGSLHKTQPDKFDPEQVNSLAPRPKGECQKELNPSRPEALKARSPEA